MKYDVVAVVVVGSGASSVAVPTRLGIGEEERGDEDVEANDDGGDDEGEGGEERLPAMHWTHGGGLRGM